MKRNLHGLLGISISLAAILTGGNAMAGACAMSSAQSCTDAEICFALLLSRTGSDAEKETLRTGIPDNFLFEIDEAFGKSFAHTLSIGVSHVASYRTAETTLDFGEGSSWNQEASAMNIDTASMKKAVDIYYTEFVNETDESRPFIQEARSRSLICPPKTKVRG
jgi:hypothetical protein